jgi:hypothetical protein
LDIPCSFYKWLSLLCFFFLLLMISQNTLGSILCIISLRSLLLFLSLKSMLKTYSHVLLNNFRVIIGGNFYLINLETSSINMESVTG